MANQKTSELTETTALASADMFYLSQGESSDKKISGATVRRATDGPYATSDQTKTNDTTLADDEVLVTTLLANRKYKLQFDIEIDSATAPDLKWDLNFTGTVTAVISKAENWNVTTASLSTGVTQTTFASWAASALNVVRTHTIAGTHTVFLRIEVKIRVGGTGGTFSFRWAQNTSSGTATIRRADSCLTVTEFA